MVDQCIKTAVISAAILFAFCAMIGLMGWAQPIQGELRELISGNGSFDDSVNTPHASERAMADNSTVNYQMTRSWDDKKDTVDSSFASSGGKGGYKDQYVVMTNGAGYKQTYRATKINGLFTGSLHSVVTMNPDGGQTLDSLTLMDGSATFQASVINATTGRPAEEVQRAMMGKFTLERYLNVTQKPKDPADWLGFCAGVNSDAPNGLLIIPAGSHYDKASKQIIKDSLTASP